jgi:aminoglycoside phosphotransferase (APT) family kinase protein
MKIDGQKLGKYSTEIRAEEIGCTTLMHGDMWTNNMLIKLNDDGSISNQILAIIDWQTFCEGKHQNY